MYIHIFTAINLSLPLSLSLFAHAALYFLWILAIVFISLLSLHICIYMSLLSASPLSLFLSLPLFLSLTIAYEVSPQNTNVLQSPWKQWEQRARRATVREFFVMLALFPNALLISMCVCMCAHAWHTFKSVFSKVLSFYLCELDEILPMIVRQMFVCFPCTCLRGCAGWVPAAPPHRCQAPLSCSWLSSQPLCRVSQLRSTS